MDSELFPTLAEKKLIEIVHHEKSEAVLVNGSIFMSWNEDDEASRRLAIVLLNRAKIADHTVLSEAFGVHINTVGKYVYRYEREGLEGLLEHRRGPRRRWKVGPERRRLILEIAVREGISGEENIRIVLKGKGVEVVQRG